MSNGKKFFNGLLSKTKFHCCFLWSSSATKQVNRKLLFVTSHAQSHKLLFVPLIQKLPLFKIGIRINTFTMVIFIFTHNDCCLHKIIAEKVLKKFKTEFWQVSSTKYVLSTESYHRNPAPLLIANLTKVIKEWSLPWQTLISECNFHN